VVDTREKDANVAEETSSGITVTERAAQEVKTVIEDQGEPNAMLRVYVAGGGCSGLQYGMALETEPMEGDQIFEVQGVRLVIDQQSFPYLNGAVVDYVEGLMGAGFKIDNPNAASSCGCGSSFSTEDSGGAAASGCGTCPSAGGH
jgi:iron-sulfur cluster assembly accessory protein